MEAWHIWVIIALLCFVLEIFTTGFAVACFSFGAIAAAIGCACGLTLIWQIILFAVFSFLAFVYVRPFVLKHFFKSGDGRETNANAIVGRKGRVTTDIDPEKGSGRVAIDGDDWKAVSADGTPIAKGSLVEVTEVNSVIITVKKI